MKRQLIMLNRLNCPVCASKLETAARRLPGMKTARVEFASGAMHVEYDASLLSEDTLRKLVRDLGVEVAAIMPGRSDRL